MTGEWFQAKAEEKVSEKWTGEHCRFYLKGLRHATAETGIALYAEQ